MVSQIPASYHIYIQTMVIVAFNTQSLVKGEEAQSGGDPGRGSEGGEQTGARSGSPGAASLPWTACGGPNLRNLIRDQSPQASEIVLRVSFALAPAHCSERLLLFSHLPDCTLTSICTSLDHIGTFSHTSCSIQAELLTPINRSPKPRRHTLWEIYTLLRRQAC